LSETIDFFGTIPFRFSVLQFFSQHSKPISKAKEEKKNKEEKK